MNTDKAGDLYLVLAAELFHELEVIHQSTTRWQRFAYR